MNKKSVLKESMKCPYLQMKNASFKYRDDMDDVLKDISFDLFKNQRVGIIGRTGAGKSTLTLAVSKIISISGGLMTIDGIDS